MQGVPPFQSFMEANGPVVHRFLVAAVGPVDAEDCFQETFLAALRAYPRLEDGRNLRGWVLTIATRKAIDFGRARRARRESGRSVDDAALHGVAARGSDVALGTVDDDDGLWRAVRSLPPRQRAAVAHRFVLDRKYADIALSLGCSVEAARANVYQGLKRLREEMRDDQS